VRPGRVSADCGQDAVRRSRCARPRSRLAAFATASVSSDPAAGRPKGPPRLPTGPRRHSFPVTAPSPACPSLCRKLSLTTRPSGASSSQGLRRERRAGHAPLRDFRKNVLDSGSATAARPDQTADRRQAAPSPLEKIQPDGWLAEYTEDLLNLLNVLGRLVALEPRQATCWSGSWPGRSSRSPDSEPQSGQRTTNRRNSSRSLANSFRRLTAQTRMTRSPWRATNNWTCSAKASRSSWASRDGGGLSRRSGRVRAELLAVLAQARAAQSLPWDARRTLYWRTVFSQMTNWLPEDEGRAIAFSNSRRKSALEAA